MTAEGENVLDSRYTLRLATPDDASVIGYHRAAMFDDMGMTGNHEAVARASAAWLAPQIAAGMYTGWLICDQTGAVIAGAGVRLFEWAAVPALPEMHYRPYLMNVYVEKEHRRRGIARYLITTIVEWAREQGYTVLTLHASDEGEPLYQQLGFTRTNEMRISLK